MRLSELLPGPREGQSVTTNGAATGGLTVGGLATTGNEIEIRGLSADSRKIEPGFLFAALPGSKADGRGFIAEAAAKGAVAVLAPAGTELPPGIALVADENPRRRLALMAARFFSRQPRI